MTMDPAAIAVATLLLLLSFGSHVDSYNAIPQKLSVVESLTFGSRLRRIYGATKIEGSDRLRKLDSPDFCIIFPGAGGPDMLTEELEKTIRNQYDGKVTVLTWDWQQHRGSVATAALDGEAVGLALGGLLNECETVHCIGISVGGFAANGLATALYQQTSDRPMVRLTLLDPFCSRGLFGAGFGARNFGVSADYAEHFLNTDDPVPTTNDPLPQCYCVDVTSAAERAKFELPEGETMHCWPLAYYARHGFRPMARGRDGKLQLPVHDKKRARGRKLIL